MKKIINLRLSILVAASLITSVTFSQGIASGNNKAGLYNNPAENGEEIVYNEISTRVQRSFYRSYGVVDGAKWYKITQGYAVCFKDNGMSTTVFYTRTGALDCRVNYYTEEKLPAHVRTLVKSNFPDHTISHVTEVHKNNVIAHLVKIQDTSTVKTVKVIDGEWELVDEVTKR